MNPNQKLPLNRKRSSDEMIRRTVSVAVFAALAYVCVFVLHIKVGFLTFDIKDAVMTVGALYFGPVAGILIAGVVSFLEFITISETGGWGLLMNFASSAVFTTGAGLLYNRRRRLSNAIIGLSVSVVGMTAVMLLMNYLITPIYYGVPRAQVVAMMPTLLLPFNLIKAVLNAALVLLLYKPMTLALARARLIRKPEGSLHFGRKNLIVTVVSFALVAVCVLLYILVLNGRFSLT